MKVKDILSVLPRHSDDSGYDVTFVEADESLRKMHWRRIDTYNSQSGRNELSDDLLNAEVLSIEAGRARPGGHFNAELHVYVRYCRAHIKEEGGAHNGV